MKKKLFIMIFILIILPFSSCSSDISENMETANKNLTVKNENLSPNEEISKNNFNNETIIDDITIRDTSTAINKDNYKLNILETIFYYGENPETFDPLYEIFSLDELKNDKNIYNNLSDKEELKYYENLGDEFFENNRVFISTLELNSGSIKLSDGGLVLNDNQIELTLDEYHPSCGLCNMAEYVVILNIDKEVSKDKNVILEINRIYEKE